MMICVRLDENIKLFYSYKDIIWIIFKYMLKIYLLIFFVLYLLIVYIYIIIINK